MSPTDEEGGPNVMTSSYERDEQKYSAEEKDKGKSHKSDYLFIALQSFV